MEHNIKFIEISDDPILRLAKDVLSGARQNRIVILPSRRAISQFKHKFIELTGAGGVVLPHCITYSDLPDCLQLFAANCSKPLPVIPQAVTAAEQAVMVDNAVAKFARDVDEYTRITPIVEDFIPLFYSNHLSVDDVPQDFVKTEEAVVYEILQNLETQLRWAHKILPQTRKLMAVRALEQGWCRDRDQVSVYLLAPVATSKYLQELFHLLSAQAQIYFHVVADGKEVEQMVKPAHPHHYIRQLLPRVFTQEQARLAEMESPIDAARLNVSRVMVAGDIVQEAKQLALHALEVLAKKEASEIYVVTENRHLVRHFKLYLKKFAWHVDDAVLERLNASLQGSFFSKLVELAWGTRVGVLAFLQLVKHPCFYKQISTDKLELELLRASDRRISYISQVVDSEHMPAELHDLYQKLKALQKRIGGLSLAAAGAELKTLFLELLHVEQHELAATIGILDVLDGLRELPYSGLDAQVTIKNILRKTIAPPDNTPSRIKVVTPIEARFLKLGYVILAGFNEGFFPYQKKNFAITIKDLINRLGLYHFNEDLGFAAFDFLNLLVSPKVVISYSQHIDGSAVAPSRFFLKIQNRLPIAQQQQEIAWVKLLEKYEGLRHKIAAEVQVDKADLPQRMSASAVEVLMQDPYKFYCHYILKLQEAEELEQELSRREFGIILHKAIATTAYTAELDSYRDEFERHFFATMHAYGLITRELFYVWQSKIAKIIPAIHAMFAEMGAVKDHKEKFMEARFAVNDFNLKLFAIADSVLDCPDGSIMISDYKTGYVPTAAEVRRGQSPQLLVEQLIWYLQHRTSAQLQYISLKGNKEILSRTQVSAEVENTGRNLQTLLGMFFCKRPRFWRNSKASDRFATYKHFMRVDEMLKAG
jgi:RecB family exonuclease